MTRAYVTLKRGDTPVEEFRRYYLEEHAPLAAEQIPHVTGYGVEFPAESTNQPFDSVAVLEFETLDDLDEALESEETAEVIDDVANFADPDGMDLLVVGEEHTFVE